MRFLLEKESNQAQIPFLLLNSFLAPTGVLEAAGRFPIKICDYNMEVVDRRGCHGFSRAMQSMRTALLEESSLLLAALKKMPTASNWDIGVLKEREKGSSGMDCSCLTDCIGWWNKITTAVCLWFSLLSGLQYRSPITLEMVCW